MNLIDSLSILLAGWKTDTQYLVYNEAQMVVSKHAAAIYKAEEIKMLEQRIEELKKDNT